MKYIGVDLGSGREYTVVKLILPFPEVVLNPNQHVHWSRKLKAQASARDAAYILTKEQGIELDPEKHYRVKLIFWPPNQRSRDLDNLVSAMKHALDGMCRALHIDDKMIKPIPDWGEICKGGRVEVIITEQIDT